MQNDSYQLLKIDRGNRKLAPAKTPPNKYKI